MPKNKKRKAFNPFSPKHQGDRNKRCKFAFVPSAHYSHPYLRNLDDSKKAAVQSEENKTSEKVKSEERKQTKPSLGQRIRKFFTRAKH